jgi:hypothetical protein
MVSIVTRFKFFLEGRFMLITIKNIRRVGIKTSAIRCGASVLFPMALSIHNAKRNKVKTLVTKIEIVEYIAALEILAFKVDNLFE